MLIEVIAETLEDAREAEQGGAGRIELVRDLERGGLTPRVELIEAVITAVRIPVRVMLRESERFDWLERGELDRLHAAGRHAEAAGAAGFVLGFLKHGAPDLEVIGRVLNTLARPATFHRAFDATAHPDDALAALEAESRIDRVLTSGGAGPWNERFERLQRWRDAAGDLTILPGGGIDIAEIRALAAAGFFEAHVGRAAREPGQVDGRVNARRVAALVAAATSAGSVS